MQIYMEMVLISPEQLKNLIRSELVSVITDVRPPKKSDDKKFLRIDEAVNYLSGEFGINISKSHMYRLCSLNEVPVSRFGSKVVFTKQDLTNWANDRIVKNSNQDEIINSIAKNARRKTSTLK
jgi:predicted DNA-binding transcriptional regulator AlpA